MAAGELYQTNPAYASIGNSADTSNLGMRGDTTSWMDSIGGYKGVQGALGIGQLGLGFMGYLDNKKTAEMQRKLLGQQYDTNGFLLDQAKGRQADIARDFGAGGTAPIQAQGLAANTAQAPRTGSPFAPKTVV